MPTWRRAIFRLPLPLFERGLEPGAIGLGPRWIRLVTSGRRTGRPHAVLVDCIDRDPAAGRWYVQSVDGERADWVKNLLANGWLEVTTSGETFRATAERISSEDAEVVLRRYVAARPGHARLVALFLGAASLSSETIVRHAARTFPTFSLRAASTAQPTELRWCLGSKIFA